MADDKAEEVRDAINILVATLAVTNSLFDIGKEKTVALIEDCGLLAPEEPDVTFAVFQALLGRSKLKILEDLELLAQRLEAVPGAIREACAVYKELQGLETSTDEDDEETS